MFEETEEPSNYRGMSQAQECALQAIVVHFSRISCACGLSQTALPEHEGKESGVGGTGHVG